MNSSIENLKLDKMLEPLDQAWQSGRAAALWLPRDLAVQLFTNTNFAVPYKSTIGIGIKGVKGEMLSYE